MMEKGEVGCAGSQDLFKINQKNPDIQCIKLLKKSKLIKINSIY